MLQSDPQIITQLQVRNRRTPDFSELRWYPEIPVFVYGTEMKNGVNNQVLKDAKYCGTAVTLSPNYIMKSTEHEPIVFTENEFGMPKNKIKGELYLCSVEHIHCLDYLKLHMVTHRRFKTRLSLLEQDSHELKWFNGMPNYQAFIYVGIPNFWDGKDLQHKSTIKYMSHEKIANVPVYEHINWSWAEDISDDNPVEKPQNDKEYEAFWGANFPEYGYEESMIH